jgi:signal transduction histidine kinase
VINIQPLNDFIAGQKLPILAKDPLNPDLLKPFSAEHINIMGSEGCFLYVVLEGEQFSQTASMISNSYITRNMLMVIFIVLVITLFIGLFLFSNITGRLNHIKSVVSNFERGQLNERINVVGHDELSELSVSFNSMADTLVQNLEEIKKADKMRRELVANVSHDLRSPLASIQGYLETIEMKGEEIDKSEMKEYMRTVLGNTQKLNQMIEDLFELTKLDTDNIRPEIELISMAELVQDLVLQFKPIAKKKNILLNANFEEIPNVLIEADMRMMSRALTNLIDNAIKHTPSGGSVSVTSVKNGKDIELEISDTGSGISEEDLPHIFDRFYQVDKSRSANNGAGLGLAIAQKILTLHGAEVSVTSRIDSGTTFKVLFPSLSA